MPTYGGTDTSKLAGADLAGRRESLQQQMRQSEEQNRTFEQMQGSVQGGLNILAQDEQAKRRESLEASRSGLEFDPSTRRYKKSAKTEGREDAAFGAEMLQREQQYRHAEQQNLITGGQALQKSQLAERGMKVQESEVGLRSRELGIREKELGAESARRQQQLDIDASREARLQKTLLIGTQQEKEEALTKAKVDATNRVEKLDSEMRKLMGPGTTEQAQLAMIAKQMGIAQPEGGAGWSKDQVAQHIRNERSRVIIDHIRTTGDMALFDPTAPENQEFLGMLATTRDMLRIDAQVNPIYLGMSYDERQRHANMTAAKAYLATQQIRAIRSKGQQQQQQQQQQPNQSQQKFK